MDIEGNKLVDFHVKSAILEGPSGALSKFLQRRLPKTQSALRQARNAKLQKVAAARWQKSPCYGRLVNINPTLASPLYMKLQTCPGNMLPSFSNAGPDMPSSPSTSTISTKPKHPPVQVATCTTTQWTISFYFCPAHDEACQLMLHKGGLDTQHKSRVLSQSRLLPHLFQFITRSGCMRAVCRDLPDLPNPEPAK